MKKKKEKEKKKKTKREEKHTQWKWYKLTFHSIQMIEDNWSKVYNVYILVFLNKCFISANFMDTLGSKEDLIKLFSGKSSFDGINNMPSPRKL